MESIKDAAHREICLNVFAILPTYLQVIACRPCSTAWYPRLIWRGQRRQGGGNPQGSNTSKLRTIQPPSHLHEDGGGTCFAESRLYTAKLTLLRF
ncbi:hypothetical protein ACXR0O_11720 [Verrucomicrobiota bacterium sgz303538]